MSVRSGHSTIRSEVRTYQDFTIIKVIEIDYERSIFDTTRYSNYPESKSVHYDFCKKGDEKKPSKHYGAWAANESECQKRIDKFLEDDSTCYTYEERQKYVYRPNKKCDWAYGYNSLMKLLKEHQNANKRMKQLIEDRLEDANFHTECGLLADCKYDEFIERISKEYTFNEKFEVITATECKRIKDPQTLVDGMEKAIADYLASQGIKNTSVNVKFIEKW